jgi:hypothetical protein
MFEFPFLRERFVRELILSQVAIERSLAIQPSETDDIREPIGRRSKDSVSGPACLRPPKRPAAPASALFGAGRVHAAG